MSTEYYQIPSQQGFLPLVEETADPWLAAATASLSINDWNINKEKQATNSLFEPDDVDAVSWRNVVPKQYNKPEVKAPVAPKQFYSTQSKIDAWGVVDDEDNENTPTTNNKQQKKAKQQNKAQPAKQAKQPKEEPKIEDELSTQNRYKTELCKSFIETGACRYGLKCQFAHGKEEVRSVLRHPKYKTEICKTFHTTGTCPYGIRCRFIHTRSKDEVIAMVQRQEEDVDDDELRLSAPPGINMPQWSKSWSMSMVPAVNNKNTHRVAVAVPEPAF